MSTYLEMCQNVRAQAGISGDGPSNVTGQSNIYADVVRWVDEAYNYIQSLHPNWNFLYTSVSFTLQETFDEYDISALNVREIAHDSFLRQFQLGDKARLKYIPYSKWRQSNQFLLADSGEPEYVTQLPTRELKFYPPADDDYEIFFEGYLKPQVMVNSTDTPIFDHIYHELIELDALKRYAQYYNAGEIYTTADERFKMLLKKMEFDELPRDNIYLQPFI